MPQCALQNVYLSQWLKSGILSQPQSPRLFSVVVGLKSLPNYFELKVAAYSPEDARARAPFIAVHPNSNFSPVDVNIIRIQEIEKDQVSNEDSQIMERRQLLYHIGVLSSFVIFSNLIGKAARAATTSVNFSGTATNFCQSIGSNGQTYCGGTIFNNGKGVSYICTASNTTSVNSFIVPCGVNSLTVTVVGGGGGGGDNNSNGSDGNSIWGGGGGAGTTATLSLTPATSVSVTVAGRASQMTNGQSSSFGSYLTASGGLCGASTSTMRGIGGAYSGGSGSNGGNGGTGSTSPTTGYAGGGGGGNGWSSGTIGTAGASATGLYGGGGGGSADQGYSGGTTGGRPGGSGGASGFAGGNGGNGVASVGASGLGPVGGVGGTGACDSRGCSNALTYQGAGGGGSYGGGGGCGGGWGSGGGGGAGGLVIITWA